MYIVIGGSDGLGKALITTLIHNGAQVTNISRRPNPQATYNLSADLSTNTGLQAAITHLTQSPHTLQAIIVSAGVFSFQGIDSLDALEFDRLFSLNTKAPFLLISALLPKIKSDQADVILINSVAGLQAYHHQTLYNASKAALHSFTRDLRAELEPTPCRVIGVYPGMIDTDLAQKIPHTPLPKSKKAMIDPQSLANYIIYTQQLPKTMEVADIIINRKKHSSY